MRGPPLGIQRQGEFILTPEILTISQGLLIAPLPNNFQEAIKGLSCGEIELLAFDMRTAIYALTLRQSPPFENILGGYKDYGSEGRKELLKNFRLTGVKTDDWGICEIMVTGKRSAFLEIRENVISQSEALKPFLRFFDPIVHFRASDLAHWQALLLQHFCLWYFNWLNKLSSVKKG